MSVIIALGVTKDGTKVPLGVWCGSTENHVATGALMQNLIERGLALTRSSAIALTLRPVGPGTRERLTRPSMANRARGPNG